MRGTGFLALLIARLELTAGMRALLVDAAEGFLTHRAIEMHAAYWLAHRSGESHPPRSDLHQCGLVDPALLCLLPVKRDTEVAATGTAGDAGFRIVGHGGFKGSQTGVFTLEPDRVSDAHRAARPPLDAA